MMRLEETEISARRGMLDHEASELSRQWSVAQAGDLDATTVKFFVEWQARLVRTYHEWVDEIRPLPDDSHYYYLGERCLAFLLCDSVWSSGCPIEQFSPAKVRLLSTVGVEDLKLFAAYFLYLKRTSGLPEVVASRHLQDHRDAASALTGMRCSCPFPQRTDCIDKLVRFHRDAFGSVEQAKVVALAMKIAQAQRAHVPDAEAAACQFVDRFYGWLYTTIGDAPALRANLLTDLSRTPCLVNAFEYTITCLLARDEAKGPAGRAR